MDAINFEILANEGSSRIHAIYELREQVLFADKRVNDIIKERHILKERHLRHKEIRGNCCRLLKKDCFAIEDGCISCRLEHLKIQNRVWLQTVESLKKDLAALESTGKISRL